MHIQVETDWPADHCVFALCAESDMKSANFYFKPTSNYCFGSWELDRCIRPRVHNFQAFGSMETKTRSKRVIFFQHSLMGIGLTWNFTITASRRDRPRCWLLIRSPVVRVRVYVLWLTLQGGCGHWKVQPGTSDWGKARSVFAVATTASLPRCRDTGVKGDHDIEAVSCHKSFCGAVVREQSMKMRRSI